MINTVRIFSDVMLMKFSLDKCTRLVIERGKVKTNEGLELSIGTMQDVQVETGYKYIEILQAYENMQTKVKEKASSLYLKRVKQVLKSKLNGPNKIQAINTYAMPVISYTGGIIQWTESEVAELDRKTRKTLTMYHALHPKSDVDRLYLPRQMGGRGLKQVRATIHAEQQSLNKYI